LQSPERSLLMYLWKCWRESRLFFVLSAALFVVFGALTIETGALHDLNPHHFGVLVSLAALLIVACAVTWYFGPAATLCGVSGALACCQRWC